MEHVQKVARYGLTILLRRDLEFLGSGGPNGEHELVPVLFNHESNELLV
jgi:hypothetical protein